MIGKKAILFCLILFSFSNLYAQRRIQMEKEGGVYKIPCVVNGVKMKMIFDTGASTVSLSMSMANFLYENDYITKDDIIGKGKSKTADGSIVDHVVINLRDIEIGGQHLRNIEATVIDGQNAPLLLGQTALKQLGSYTINGSSLVLNEVDEGMSDEELDELDDKVETAIANHQYYSAIEYLRKIESVSGLSAFGYLKLVRCLISVKQHKEAIEAGKEGLKSEDLSDDVKSLICSFIASSYFMTKDYSNCIKYSELSIINSTDLYSLYLTYSQMGFCYEKMGNKSEAERNYKKALNRMMSLSKTSVFDIYEGNVNNENIGVCFHNLACLFLNDSDKAKCCQYAGMGAMCKNKDCMSICEYYGYDYKMNNKNFIKYFKDNPNIIEGMKKQYSMTPD